MRRDLVKRALELLQNATEDSQWPLAIEGNICILCNEHCKWWDRCHQGERYEKPCIDEYYVGGKWDIEKMKKDLSEEVNLYGD